ncbi:MAG: amino acid permease [Lachnospiraceae bacterium]|nr:amino acid permease [Lachnospiraceae bacterium]
MGMAKRDGTGDKTEETGQAGLRRYLSPLAVWALSFGCAVGWGAFVMPGTTFLPIAGPAGTVLGLLIGALVMWVIGVNYHYLMNRYPDTGGTLTYTIRAFGYDHGFLSAWFLILVYVAIMWANATAMALIMRKLFSGLFQFGFHYQVLGYDIWLGEVLISIAVIVLCGLLCIYGKRLAVMLQVILALVLFGGIVFCAVMAGSRLGLSSAAHAPLLSPTGGNMIKQVLMIVALAPWAFAGFESVSNSAEGFCFQAKKTLPILTVSLVTGAIVYIVLALFGAAAQPKGYADWPAYLADLDNLGGVEGIPVFYTAQKVLGKAGKAVLTILALAAILTGLIGNYIAGSRLMYAMAKERILPAWFGRLNDDAVPQNALWFLLAISLVIPFLGRTAIGWIIDVNTVGATIAYGYTSASALVLAHKEQNRKIRLCGIIGVVMSVFFFFYFMSWSADTMATESYLILAGWSILGFIWFRYVFGRDKERRFGRSTVVWIGLLFLIFFTSLMWVKQATDEMTREVIDNISSYYEEQGGNLDQEMITATEAYVDGQLQKVNRTLTRNSIIQMALIIASLGIMFSIYTTISKREKQSEVEKLAAQESDRAKTVFLSNMSHDIRTPMNAIIGYTNLAERENLSLEEVRKYLEKIKGSGQHLLALINDVLEMSRIESGKMELEPIPVNLPKTVMETEDLFATQMAEKNIAFSVTCANVRHPLVYCDKNRLNRVLLNLVSNAYKFTPDGGTVSVTVWEVESGMPEYGRYEIRVADSGIGMSKEFAEHVFEAFERERNSTVSGIQGTGLGMSITKSLVDMMGGEITLNTAPDHGTEFVIRLSFRLQEQAEEEDAEEQEQAAEVPAVDFSSMRLLLVEDMPINREIANMQLCSLGFAVEYAENGQEALDKVQAAEAGYYDGVLMDIQMPVMNGYEACEAIRALEEPDKAGIPVIAMTANAFSEDVKRAMDAGMNAHIAKPIDMNVLKNVLKEVLGKSGRR